MSERSSDQRTADEPDVLGQFAAAVNADDVAAATAILSDHPDLRSKLNDPMPGFPFDGVAMSAAARRRSEAMIDLLLGAGADIDAKSQWWAGGFSALDLVDPSFAQALISRGATVTIHAAARLGMLDRVEQHLLADPNVVHARGGDGQTPLHVAATVDVARMLVSHGADIDARDIDHESTPAMYHVGDRPDVTRYLMSLGCATDILMASAVGDVDLVREWLDRYPESIRTTVSEDYFPQRNPRAGGTIYIWTLGGSKSAHAIARERHHDDVLQMLMARTPDSLAFALAAEFGDEQVFAKLMADNPGMVETLTTDEQRKLVSAAERNNANAVRLMLGAGWPVSTATSTGATALHWAAFHGNADMTAEILRHHPNVDAVETTFGGTPMGWAEHGSRYGWSSATGDFPATIVLLKNAGAR